MMPARQQKRAAPVRVARARTVINPPVVVKERKMASYILRKIDPELWARVKSKAALEQVTVKALIESLLRKWLEAA